MPRNTSKTQDSCRRLLTVKEVAELDNCSEKTVRRAIDAGRLAVLRIGPDGRLLRISQAAHLAYRHRGLV